MKRTKLVASLMMCVFCLSFLVVGVFAAVSTANLNINGNLKYYPEGVFVELSGQVYRGTSITDMNPVTSDSRYSYGPAANFDGTLDQPSGNFPLEAWNIGNISFIPTQKFIKISVTITNYSDFAIMGTPNITIDNTDITSNTNFKVTPPENISNIASLQTVTADIIIEVLATQEVTGALNVSFEFEERRMVANYNYFEINNLNKIIGMSDFYYENPPEVLVIPAYAEGTNELLILGDPNINLHGPYDNGIDGAVDLNNPYINLSQSTITLIIEEGIEGVHTRFFSSQEFEPNFYVTDIMLPSTLKEITCRAFRSCKTLKNIDFGRGLINIYDYAFSSCAGIINITLPKTLERIGRDAFSDCTSLKTVEILSDNVEFISSRAFNGCSALESFTIHSINPPDIYNNTFPENLKMIYVPEESLEIYKTTNYWSEYADIIYPIN